MPVQTETVGILRRRMVRTVLWLMTLLTPPMALASNMLFDYVEVDAAGPVSPWGKAVGDINGDGLTDIIVGGHRPAPLSLVQRIFNRLGIGEGPAAGGELVWYAAPDWTAHIVSTAFHIRTDIETGDLDGDGQCDIVALTDRGVVWFRGPDWTPRVLDPRKFHDLELADLDADDRLEIVLRNQSLFGHGDGQRVEILDDVDHLSAPPQVLMVEAGEGLLVRDLNADNVPEIIVNSLFLQREGDSGSAGRWRATRFAADDWEWQDVFLAADDIDGDGRVDIVQAPAEEAGGHYRLSWFRAPPALQGAWQEVIIEPSTESVHHFVGTADFDGDGLVDIATAQMNQGADPDEVAIYRNLGAGGERFAKQVLASTGSHSMRIFDADGDFDPDLVGANWHREDYTGDYPVQLWRNNAAGAAPAWTRHVVDRERPGQALFVLPANVDGDSSVDIISGAYWYQNPGSWHEAWPRRAIGAGAENAVLTADFDADGRVDILASGWLGYGFRPSIMVRALGRLGMRDNVYGRPGNTFVFARNLWPDGFQIVDLPEPARGDFLQGATLLERDGRREVVLSFHQSGSPLQSFSVPARPTTEPWHWQLLSGESQNEAVSEADLDGDGRMDIVTGTRFLSGNALTPRVVHATSEAPDRHRIADIDGDGDVDVVIGYESPSRPGKVAWYQQSGEQGTWTEHVIARLTGPMSLDVGDIDGDGDMDVVVGEHNLTHPDLARLVWLENRDGIGGAWRGHLIHTGDEHHNGARLTDIDSDGDLDVVSIGWSHGGVFVYENPGWPLS